MLNCSDFNNSYSHQGTFHYSIQCHYIFELGGLLKLICMKLTFFGLPCTCAGKHAIPNLVSNLPGGGQSQPVRNLSEETVVSVLSTLAEVVCSSVDAAKVLRSSQGIERLVLINKDGSVCLVFSPGLRLCSVCV